MRGPEWPRPERLSFRHPGEQERFSCSAGRNACFMGIALSKLWGVLFSGKNYKVVIVGLDNAGKTTTLYKLHLGDVVVTQPTIGSNVEHISHRNVHFEAWDLGGQDTLRPSWQSYYLNAHAIILGVLVRAFMIHFALMA